MMESENDTEERQTDMSEDRLPLSPPKPRKPRKAKKKHKAHRGKGETGVKLGRGDGHSRGEGGGHGVELR